MITDSRTRALLPLERTLFLLQMRTTVFFHYLGKAFRGELPFKKLPSIFKRLLHFNNKQKHAKFMNMPNGIRMGLYIPSFPGKPFFRASEAMCLQGNKVHRAIAVVSITNSCECNCIYCYQRLDKGKELPLEILKKTISEMQDDGVAIFILEGGDPFLAYDRLLEVCKTIDDRSEIWVNTTGNGITRERLLKLQQHGLTALKISVHHHEREKHEEFLRHPGAWDELKDAIKLCHELDIPFSFNSVMHEDDYENGHFIKMMELARNWNAAYIQCLTPRSAGGYIGKNSISYSKEKVQRLGELFTKYNRAISHLAFPAIFCDEYDERAVFGCTAGGAGRIYMNAQGELQPCQHINVSFGNVKESSYTALIKKAEKIFQSPAKQTACTMIARTVAKRYNEKKVVPIPFEDVKDEWIRLRDKDSE